MFSLWLCSTYVKLIVKYIPRGGYEICPPPYKTKNLKHRHVAYQNDRIEILITNLSFERLLSTCNSCIDRLRSGYADFVQSLACVHSLQTLANPYIKNLK